MTHVTDWLASCWRVEANQSLRWKSTVNNSRPRHSALRTPLPAFQNPKPQFIRHYKKRQKSNRAFFTTVRKMSSHFVAECPSQRYTGCPVRWPHASITLSCSLLNFYEYSRDGRSKKPSCYIWESEEKVVISSLKKKKKNKLTGCFFGGLGTGT
jgi:hypothetical protein